MGLFFILLVVVVVILRQIALQWSAEDFISDCDAVDINNVRVCLCLYQVPVFIPLISMKCRAENWINRIDA